MPTIRICDRLRAWCGLYPDPSASAGRNATARDGEDSRLGRFAGSVALERDQVIELIG
jgi:hypothetical protein